MCLSFTEKPNSGTENSGLWNETRTWAFSTGPFWTHTLLCLLIHCSKKECAISTSITCIYPQNDLRESMKRSRVRTHVAPFSCHGITTSHWCLTMRQLAMPLQAVMTGKLGTGIYKSQLSFLTKSTHQMTKKCCTWRRAISKGESTLWSRSHSDKKNSLSTQLLGSRINCPLWRKTQALKAKTILSSMRRTRVTTMQLPACCKAKYNLNRANQHLSTGRISNTKNSKAISW